MFQIEGDKRQGMVCVEATRDMSNLRQLTVSLLTVDVFRSSGQADLVVVSGDKDRLQVCCDLVTPTSSWLATTDNPVLLVCMCVTRSGAWAFARLLANGACQVYLPDQGGTRVVG